MTISRSGKSSPESPRLCARVTDMDRLGRSPPGSASRRLSDAERLAVSRLAETDRRFEAEEATREVRASMGEAMSVVPRENGSRGQTVRVYQAYNDAIADGALRSQRFVDPWKPTRMTWIKPSFVWMGYRCGWASKDRNQERVLAIDLWRPGFDALLLDAVSVHSSHGGDDGAAADVIVQWDPERGLGGKPGREAHTHALPAVRSLQMGLRGAAARRLGDGVAGVPPLVAGIEDVTAQFRAVGERLEAGDFAGAAALLPQEQPYPLPPGCSIGQVEACDARLMLQDERAV